MHRYQTPTQARRSLLMKATLIGGALWAAVAGGALFGGRWIADRATARWEAVEERDGRLHPVSFNLSLAGCEAFVSERPEVRTCRWRE